MTSQTFADSSSPGLWVFSADGGIYSRDVKLALVLSGVLMSVAQPQKQHIVLLFFFFLTEAADEIKVHSLSTARLPSVV